MARNEKKSTNPPGQKGNAGKPPDPADPDRRRDDNSVRHLAPADPDRRRDDNSVRHLAPGVSDKIRDEMKIVSVTHCVEELGNIL